MFIINAAMASNYDTYSKQPEANSELTEEYLVLKNYEQELKGNIAQIKREMAEEEAYLASLDVELIELERQYNRQLEEYQSISDRLNSLNAAKNH